MSLLTENPTSLEWQQGPSWSSFEKFRNEGAKSLESIKDGTVASLHTKTGQYRILEEHDFQTLLGLARDVERLKGGLRVVGLAVRIVQKHPDDPDSVSLLVEAVTEAFTMLGCSPELPTRSNFDYLSLEDDDIDPDDEVTLDPDQIERPLSAQTGVLETNVC